MHITYVFNLITFQLFQDTSQWNSPEKKEAGTILRRCQRKRKLPANFEDQPKVKCEKCHHINIIPVQEEEKQRKLSLKNKVISNDSTCYEYTGLPTVAMFYILFKWLTPAISELKNWDHAKKRYISGRCKIRSKNCKMSPLYCYLMTLIRLKKGFDVKHLGYLFGISHGHVSKIFIAWVNLLSQCLKPLIKWPSQQVARDNLPKLFKSQYPKTRCIIDCTDLTIEKPFRPMAQKLTWSNYKHNNTVKVLVGIHPSGGFTFLSKVYAGSISDLDIIRKSGFLNLIEPGDDVMADRGFNIRHLLLKKKATLNIPAFSKGTQLSSKALNRSRKIASVRIHVERAIRQMKCFNIVKGTISNKLKPYLEQIVTVVSALNNFQKPIC